MSTKTGGRQGCKLGAFIFNSVYSIALDALGWELSQAGIDLKLPVPTTPFWAPAAASEYDSDPTPVVDATFVDDECFVLLASTGAALDTAIDVLLSNLFHIFSNLHLAINTKPGKTEALLKYRGAGACALREARRCSDA